MKNATKVEHIAKKRRKKQWKNEWMSSYEGGAVVILSFFPTDRWCNFLPSSYLYPCQYAAMTCSQPLGTWDESQGAKNDSEIPFNIRASPELQICNLCHHLRKLTSVFADLVSSFLSRRKTNWLLEEEGQCHRITRKTLDEPAQSRSYGGLEPDKF